MTAELHEKSKYPDVQRKRARMLRRLAEPHDVYGMILDEARHAGVLRPRSITAISLSKEGFTLLGSGTNARKLAVQHGNQPPGTILMIVVPEEM